MKSKLRDTFCGVIFLSFLIMYTCCGCAKEAPVNPSSGCYECDVQKWEERQDGYASNDVTTKVELCNYTEAAIHLFESKNTYNEKRPTQYGYLSMYHSRAVCTKK